MEQKPSAVQTPEMFAGIRLFTQNIRDILLLLIHDTAPAQYVIVAPKLPQDTGVLRLMHGAQ